MTIATPKPSWFEKSLDTLASSVPAPRICKVHGKEVYRYSERLPEQAAVLKLANFISGLNAVSVLLSQGFVLEAGAIQRTQYETYEDILFICAPSYGLERTDLHEVFFQAFWEEEPDFKSHAGNQKNRHLVPRKKIRAYLATIGVDKAIDHASISLSGYLARMHSGFVHAAGPHSTSLYDPGADRFRTNGHASSPLQQSLSDTHCSLSIDGAFAVAWIARAFKQPDLEREAFGLYRRLMAPREP